MTDEDEDIRGVVQCAMRYMDLADEMIAEGKPVGQVIAALHSASFNLAEERSPDAKNARRMKKAMIESDVNAYMHDLADATGFEQRCAVRLFEKLEDAGVECGKA